MTTFERVVVEIFVVVIIGALIGSGLSMAGVDLFAWVGAL